MAPLSLAASADPLPPLRHADTVVRIQAARAQEPLWVDGPTLTPQALAMLHQIAAAGDDGLEPADYHLQELMTLLAFVAPVGEPVWADAEAGSRAEDLLTDAFLGLGVDLASGRVEPGALWNAWAADGERPGPLPRLADAAIGLPGAAPGRTAAAADTLLAVLAGCRPTQPGYRELRGALVDLRNAAAAGGWPKVADGPRLRPGDRDPRVRQVRARLLGGGGSALPLLAPAAPWCAAEAGARYDPALVAAVGAFQRRHGLADDGVIGPQTLAALNVTAQQRALQVTLNLERWRWLPRDPGPRHLLVNIPDFSLALVEDGVPTLTMRAVVGRPDRPTPVVSGLMEWLMINPGWSVPQKLAREDLLPKVAADPGYLADRGFRVYADWRPGAAEIDPAGVDWRAIDPLHLGYKFFQAPGPRNPLGRVKFMFQNDFSVYIHDTDQRGIFAKDQRCFSSGCVRIEAPDALLQQLALRGEAPAGTAVQTAMKGDKSVALALAEAMPVHLVYLTCWVEADGTLQFRRDCYGYDEELATALAKRALAPVAPPRPLPPAVIARAVAPAPAADYQVRTGPVSMWTKREAE